ncbi:MAG: DUF4388 domain-containing protein [Deltaproteobacteria bacterium]|nr:DUF4388 domain-containing protein [bacterium]MCB9476103.1 DUF4388 domain-containing protein [Deltaproteobacteria bacterium]MCB9488654.1 DUF4388 domain-containing protein [Deltaproteobacteria bacterium]
MSSSAGEGSYVKGSLAQTPFPNVLHYIHIASKTGILAVVRGPKKVHIHYDSGRIVYVTSSYFPELSIGEYLVHKNLISSEDAKESFEATRDGDTKQGMYLVDQGKLTPHKLHEALNEHVKLKLFKIFGWPDGEFFFKQGPIIEPEHRVLTVHMGNLIYTGVRDHFPMKSLPREFKGRKESAVVKRESPRFAMDEIAFGPADTRMLALVNGQLTLRQIVTASKLKKSQAYHILYGLYLLGFVGFPESVRRRPEANAGGSYQERVLREQEEKAKRQAAKQRQGYEINIADDVIAEALKSVDRAKEAVRSATTTMPAPIPDAPVPTAPATTTPATAPAETTEPDIFGESVDADSELFFETAAQPADEEVTQAFDDNYGWQHEPEETPTEFEDISPETYLETEDTGIDLSAYDNAEDLTKQGQYLMEEGRFNDAEKFFEKALEMDPDSAEASVHLGWTKYNRSAGMEVQDSERLIRDGLKRNPAMFQAFLYLGKIYMAENQMEFAELHFVKALELNVDCAEAREQIKKIHAG